MSEEIISQEGSGQPGKEEAKVATERNHPSVTAIAAALVAFAALPKAFEQHPRGGLTVIAMVILVLAAWLGNTWIQHH